MTIALYVRTKKWPLESVVIRLRHSRIHAKDCADCMTRSGLDIADLREMLALLRHWKLFRCLMSGTCSR